MARIRSVHPSLFTDEAWVSCSPLARVLYIGLMTEADDQGLFEWKLLQIKMRLLPIDNADIPALLGELVAVNLIAGLEAGGKKLGAIRYFRRFQRPKKPNAHFVLPPEWRTYVGLKDDGSELPEDEPEEVRNQFPTSGEKSPQMEDGGGEKEEDADASLSPAGDGKPEYPEEFEACWKAYPHIKGRSSKPKAHGFWKRITPGRKALLPAACTRYGAEGREPKAECGAPGMHLWLRDQKYLDWLAATPELATVTAWEGPADIRAIVSAHHPESADGYLKAFAWRPDPAALVTSSPTMFGKLKDCEADLAQAGCALILERKAA